MSVTYQAKGLIHLGYCYKYLLPLSCQSPMFKNSQYRNMWSWLNPVWNKYDKERVKEVGPDQAAAEWLLRCGAAVNFVNNSKWEKDYNSLVSQIPSINEAKTLKKSFNSKESEKPNVETFDKDINESFTYLDQNSTTQARSKFIRAIDTNESGVDDSGFEYLDGLKYLNEILLRFSPYLTDGCLAHIAKYSASSLNHLTIEDCYEISEWGLLNNLVALKQLKSLKLKNLPLIKDDKETIKIKLMEVLPRGCEVAL